LAEAIAARTRASGRAQQLALPVFNYAENEREGLKAGIQAQNRSNRTTTVVLDAKTVYHEAHAPERDIRAQQ
jgi:hypothetical protein